MTITLAPRDVGEPVARRSAHPDPIVLLATHGAEGYLSRRGYLLKASFTASLTFSSACLTPLTCPPRQWRDSQNATGFARRLNFSRGPCPWCRCGCGAVVRPGLFHVSYLTL